MRGEDASNHLDRFFFIMLATGVQIVFILGPAFNDVIPGIQPPLAGSGIVPPPVVSGGKIMNGACKFKMFTL